MSRLTATATPSLASTTSPSTTSDRVGKRLSASIVPASIAHQFASNFDEAMSNTSSAPSGSNGYNSAVNGHAGALNGAGVGAPTSSLAGLAGPHGAAALDPLQSATQRSLPAQSTFSSTSTLSSSSNSSSTKQSSSRSNSQSRGSATRPPSPPAVASIHPSSAAGADTSISGSPPRPKLHHPIPSRPYGDLSNSSSLNTSPPSSHPQSHPKSFAPSTTTSSSHPSASAAGAASAASQNNGAITLRARRGSVSSRPPSTSIPSPQLADSPPQGSRSKEVGLGLMLDSEAGNGPPPPTTGGSAALRAREMLARLGLDASDMGSSGTSSGGSSPTLAGGEDWKTRSIPRVSTTTAGGGGVSPLLVYTGTPLLTPSVSSPSSYPRSGSPSMLMTPKSSAMDRSTGSGSSHRSSSDIHTRHQSLTSACAPVTSGVSSPNLSDLYPPPSPNSQKSYWDDPRKGAKAAHGPRDGSSSVLGNLVALPSTLLAFLLTPITGAPSQPALPMLSAATGGPGASSSTVAGKRWPLPFRLLAIAYLIFSCGVFSLRLVSPSSEFAGGDPKLRPRDTQEVLVATGLMDANADAERFVLGRMGEGVGTWAQKVAGVAHWPAGLRGGRDEVEERAVGNEEEESGESEEMVEEDWGIVKRVGNKADVGVERSAANNQLTGLTHPYRFAKMHDKIHWDIPDEIEPYLFRATGAPPDANDVTACLYSNDAWLQTLPAFVAAWGGPVSLVFETAHSRTSPLRPDLVEKIAQLREKDSLVREYVDFHIVGTPTSSSERTMKKTRERLITRPVALNFHSNLARFFAPTDLIYLVGDARIVPSQGLRQSLKGDSIRKLALEKGDVVVVPTFGFVRDIAGEGVPAPSTATLREQYGLPATANPWDGVSEEEYDILADAHITELLTTLPLQPEEWPQKKAGLVSFVRTRAGTPDRPSDATMALFDRRWDLNHGPSNWYLWRKSATDSRLLEPPELGGGIGLGVDGGVGGGKDVFRVTDYDLHFAPGVMVSKKGQPWCTERFEHMPAACVYQMYLAGAELWVLPDQWAFTVERIDKAVEIVKPDPAEKLRNSISSRLYGKFHQEACMHYGREFLSVQMWDSDKAQHLRAVCARTLGTWGMGDVPVTAPKQ